jgi:hypothetical protein
VVLANAFPTGAPEGLADSFFDLVFDGRVAEDWFVKWNGLFASMFEQPIEAGAVYARAPDPQFPALPLTSYVGRYVNDFFGDAVVSDVGGALVLRLGPKGEVSFSLKPFSRDRFSYRPAEESPALSGVAFAIGADQMANEVTIDDLNGFGMGILKRIGD